jgi:hypothetical protein
MTDSQTEAIRITRAVAAEFDAMVREGRTDVASRTQEAAALRTVADLAERAGESTYWLMERDGEYYAAAPYSDWTIKQALDPDLWKSNWTKDAHFALRFCRQEDACALIAFMGLQRCFAVDHMDIASARTKETKA